MLSGMASPRSQLFCDGGIHRQANVRRARRHNGRGREVGSVGGVRGNTEGYYGYVRLTWFHCTPVNDWFTNFRSLRNIFEKVPYSCAGCPTGKGEKLNSSQGESSHAINLAVAYFPSISCGGILRTSTVLRLSMSDLHLNLGENHATSSTNLKKSC